MRPMPMRRLLMLLLALCSLPALAVNYTFPGSMPTGCNGSAGTYTCGNLALGFNDTVTISGTVPATITVNGNLTTNNARINQAGSAANLTLTVTGTLTAEYQAVLNANVNTNVLNGSGTEVVFGGNVAATGAVTLGYRTRVVGNLSGASLSTGTEINFGGNITTTGNLSVGYASTLTGSVTAGGTLRLNGNTQAPQCLRTTAASNLRLEWADRANGGVCCGALGSCTTSCVTNNSGAAMPALCAGAPPVAAGRFNAFDTATAAGSINGVIRTKVSGLATPVAIVAINTAGTAVATTFTGNVRVEVLDASNNTGALNGSTNCRASWNVAAGTSATTLSFAASDNGRKNVTLTVPEAFRDARIRVSYPDTGTATVVGCSSDNFAIRPASFTLTASDSNSSTAATSGTPRLLNNTTTTGVVHKAGQPFTLNVRAVNNGGTTTANYVGTPVVAAPSACTNGRCGALTYSNVAAVSGQVTTHTASYSEVGTFTLQFSDTSFSLVDNADGSTASERDITGTLTVGRFVPDRFAIANYVTPRLLTFNSSTCASRSFTYLGQPFGYATRPEATVTALNANGGITTNYAFASGFAVSQAHAVGASAPGLTTIVSAPTLAVVTPGTARLSAQATDSFTMTRPATAPVTNFSANTLATGISLTWNVQDTSETLTGTPGNQSIVAASALQYAPIAFDQGTGEFRYGQFKLGSAYGSELIALAVPLETQYWNGTGFVTNAADQCTTLPTGSVSLANFRSNLAACETTPTTTSLTMVNGRATLRLQAPGNGNSGSVDGSLQLGATVTTGAVRCAALGPAAVPAVAANLPWLQTRLPGGTTFDQNPSARFSFGQYRSPVIQLREMY